MKYETSLDTEYTEAQRAQRNAEILLFFSVYSVSLCPLC